MLGLEPRLGTGCKKLLLPCPALYAIKNFFPQCLQGHNNFYSSEPKPDLPSALKKGQDSRVSLRNGKKNKLTKPKWCRPVEEMKARSIHAANTALTSCGPLLLI